MENVGPILRRTGSHNITFDLLDEGRIVQGFRVCYFAVHNSVFSQVFPNLLGVNVFKGIFRSFRGLVTWTAWG